MDSPRTVQFNLVGTLDVSPDLKPEFGWDGRIIGYRNSQGWVIRPQVVLEVEYPNGEYEDFSADQDLDRLGFTCLDYSMCGFEE